MANEQLIKDVIKWIITTKNTEMLDESDVDLVYNDYVKEQVGNVPEANACPQLCEGWRDAAKELPSCKNGYVDTLVIVVVKNKNKPDGIWLMDVSWFDGETWGKRNHTWEDILYWHPKISPPAFV